MERNKQWNDEKCSNKYYFICAYYSDGYRPELESKKLQNAKMTSEFALISKHGVLNIFGHSRKLLKTWQLSFCKIHGFKYYF